MSVDVSHDFNTAVTSWVRKRKRNNSSVSLPDGIVPPASTPTTSPQKVIDIPRPSTPPPGLPRSASDRSSALSPYSSSLPANLPTSPIAVRSVAEDVSLAGSQSPRAAVAKRLSGLNLSKSHDSPSYDEHVGQSPSQDQQDTTSDQNAIGPETDDFALNQPERPPLHHASSSNQRPKKRVPPPRGIKSPPPKSHKPPGTSTADVPKSAASSSTTTPTTATDESADNATSLTWQDSEITGHLMQDPEDDGYGINGIGFRPTPAMATARSQRRKQQLTAWRTREEREERERRAEKRRQGRALYAAVGNEVVMPVPKFNLSMLPEAMDKKAVRFAV